MIPAVAMGRRRFHPLVLFAAVLLGCCGGSHQPALGPGCGEDCAGLPERDGLPITVARAGIHCARGSGLSSGMLLCHTTAQGGSGAALATFVVDPDDPEQLRQVLTDGASGALHDAGEVDDWLRKLDDSSGGEAAGVDRGTLQHKDPQREPVVAWFRECGCTGLQMEASHFVAPLTKLLTANRTAASSRAELRRRIFTNACPADADRCRLSPEVQGAIDAVAVPVGSFWRMAELALRNCGADVAQLRAYERLNASAKQQWGCTAQTIVALQLVIHVGPTPGGGGPCAWPDAARWLRHAPNVVAISRSMFEVDGIPAEAVERCNEFDEVWVPASFNVHTFSQSGVAVRRLRTLPEGFDPTIFYKAVNAAAATQEAVAERERSSGAVDWGALAMQAEDEDKDDKAGADNEVGPGAEEEEAEVQLPEAVRRFFGAADDDNIDAFVFLSVFKWESRKGWRQLLAAFWAEFLPKQLEREASGMESAVVPRVRLLIKTSMPMPPDKDLLHHSDRPVHQVASWAWELGWDVSTAMAMVHVFDGFVESAALGDLYRSADSFVLATHGEGWGLPLLEGMACGLPTIATAWGGQTDFMREDRAFLVAAEAELVEADDSSFAGFRWAEPSYWSLRRAMRAVVDGSNGPTAGEAAVGEAAGEAKTQAVARKGYEWAHANFRWENVALIAQRMLEAAAVSKQTAQQAGHCGEEGGTSSRRRQTRMRSHCE